MYKIFRNKKKWMKARIWDRKVPEAQNKNKQNQNNWPLTGISWGDLWFSFYELEWQRSVEPHNLEILRGAFPTKPRPQLPLFTGKNDLENCAHKNLTSAWRKIFSLASKWTVSHSAHIHTSCLNPMMCKLRKHFERCSGWEFQTKSVNILNRKKVVGK